jgi:hypothetical protein
MGYHLWEFTYLASAGSLEVAPIAHPSGLALHQRILAIGMDLVALKTLQKIVWWGNYANCYHLDLYIIWSHIIK